jgi:hypothetical protein
MAVKGKAAKAAGATAVAKTQPYVQRLVQDEDLRDNLRTAFDSAKVAYGRLNNGKAPQKALLEDKKLQKSLKEAATSLKDAQTALAEGPKKKRKGGLGRLILLTVVGGGVALALSEGLRTKVLDALFGKEEEFEYTSTTSPPTPAPTSPAGSTA